MIDKKTLEILEYDKILEALAELAATEPGKLLCKELKPATDYEQVLLLQEETAHAVQVILKQGRLPLAGANDILPIVERAKTGSVLSCRDFLNLQSFLQTAVQVKASLPADKEESLYKDDYPLQIFERLEQIIPLKHLLKRLDESIAGEDEIYDRASSELYKLRKSIRDTQQNIKDQLARIIRKYAHSLQEQLVTMRSDRYVVPLKADHRGDLAGIVHDTSSSGATLFVEPMAVVELNNKVRELMNQEHKEIERILQELSLMTAEAADDLLINAYLLRELDLFMAKGQLALKWKAMPPRINNEGRINLKAARHPLIASEKVVPIDFELGKSFNTLVITGPNTGGKTVTLKTCGLFTLMAMAGLQLPAQEGSEISWFAQVLADIGDEQSIEQDLSTFSSHLRRLIQITETAGQETLVLVDELGSGTDPAEGASLAVAILDYLHHKKCRTIATTHFKELKMYALKTPLVENACCEFDTKTLQPTYKLLIGIPGVSNAFAISQRLGLNTRIIDHARSLISQQGIEFEEVAQIMEKNKVETEKLKAETLSLHQEALALREQLTHEQRALKERKQGILQKAREEARELYQEAEADITEQLQELKKQIKEENSEKRRHLSALTRRQLRTSRNHLEKEMGQDALAGIEGKPPKLKDLKIGREYAAPALGISGKLVAGPDSKKQCIIQQGAMQVTVPAASLRLLAAERPAGKAQSFNSGSKGKKHKTTGDLSFKTKLSQSTEIKLLGLTVDEATIELDLFIDQALLAGLGQLRIVHGKGTGALRAAVHSMLKQDTRIASFQMAAYGEGDSGVTIAELK